MARRRSPPTPPPTPIPMVAPRLREELEPPPPPGLEGLVERKEEGERVVEDVIILLPDVKTVTVALPGLVELAPDARTADELFALEEPPAGVVEPESCVSVAVPDARMELGLWPSRNWILCPTLLGREAKLLRLMESLKATVADAASVQLQYEPGCRVVGSPFWEQMAHSPLLLSQSVRATHG